MKTLNDKTKDVLLVTLSCLLLISCFTIYTLSISNRNLFFSEIPLDFSMHSIHTKITFLKNGIPILSEYHAGHVTNLGLNITLGKLSGNSTFWLAEYSKNVTYISIGNQGTLTTSSVILPGEWNRTSGKIDNVAYNHFNVSCTFHPDAGPYTADCIGLNLASSGNDLWGYDTFTEVTGIDNTFTINVDIEVTAS
jgi:hypothetical protein